MTTKLVVTKRTRDNYKGKTAAQEAFALLLSSLVGCPVTDIYPEPAPDPITRDTVNHLYLPVFFFAIMAEKRELAKLKYP